VNVDRGETSLSERPSHLDVSVDTLLSENGDLGTVVERSEAFEEGVGDVDGRIEREFVEESRVVLPSDVLVLLEGSSGTVSEGLHLVRSFGPLLLKLSASRRPEERSSGSDADRLIFSVGRDATDGNDRGRGETGVDEDLCEGSDVGLTNLEDCSQLLVEECCDRIVVLLERVNHDLGTDATYRAGVKEYNQRNGRK
jgi:hypothetical protein